MVFTGISKLIRLQLQLLGGAFNAEDHERRLQQQLEKKAEKKQRKLARRAARENRRAQRKQRRTLLSPTVVAEPTNEEERSQSSIDYSGKQPQVQPASCSLVWARTAEARTKVPGAIGIAGGLKSKPSGGRWHATRGKGPERVDLTPEEAEVTSLSVLQVASNEHQLPSEFISEYEAKLEQKQREFYDSLGGYSTVDEEEDDELHELLVVNQRASDTRISIELSSTDTRKAAESVEPTKTDVSKLCETQGQEEAGSASPGVNLTDVLSSASKPRLDAILSLTRLIETDSEDVDVDPCAGVAFEGNSVFDEQEGSHSLFLANHVFEGHCISPAHSSSLISDQSSCVTSIAVHKCGADPDRCAVENDVKVGGENEVIIKQFDEIKHDKERLLGVSVLLNQAHAEVLPETCALFCRAVSEATKLNDTLCSESSVESDFLGKLNGPKGVEVEISGTSGAVNIVKSGSRIGDLVEPQRFARADLSGQQVKASDLSPHLTVQSCRIAAGNYSPGMVDEYACAIYKNLRDREHRYHVTEDIFAEQQTVQPQMRAVLVDWLVEVHQRFELEAQTLYLTVNYVDRYLAQVPVNIQRFQLVGVAALLIASKFEEIYPCDMDDLLYICERSYSKADLVECERDLLNVFAFNLAVPTVSSFLGYFLEQCEEDKLIGQLANLFAECSLLDFGFGAKYEPSIVACACLLAASCYVGNQGPRLVWNYRLVELTGYAIETIIPCTQKLQTILANPTKLTAVATKYSDKAFGEVACLPLEGLNALLC
uniref:Cyclin N-terminal domain-containing protein n=1 Tax=Peronospora matthiolae TaxID=2874970 RepID=A0AAV1VN71_9STRA